MRTHMSAITAGSLTCPDFSLKASLRACVIIGEVLLSFHRCQYCRRDVSGAQNSRVKDICVVAQ